MSTTTSMKKTLLLAASSFAVVVPATGSGLGTDAERAAGKELYIKYCGQCHGEDGDGVGYATNRVKPAPRDFTSGKYKIRTTPSGRLPTDDDLRKVIREGLPYTSMPGWPNFSDQEVQNLIYHLKTYSSDFESSEMRGEPMEIPQPPPSTPESIERGREIYGELGCAACHGEVGRGDGPSAPTLTDDWGDHIRAADLTMRWTFRGGPTRRDVFRTFSTGLNGTPMPSYADSLAIEDRWHLVNYIFSLGEGNEPEYDTLLIARYIEEELDLSDPATLFEGAIESRFPLLGQIVEPGRNFYPSASSVRVQAVYNRGEIAFRVRWNDMRAETAGSNGPNLEVPLWDEEQPPDGATGNGGFFGEEAGEGDFWGGSEVEDDGGFFGEAEAEDDFFGEAETGEDDFWGTGEESSGGAAGGEFSDAVALQFPSQLPSGNRKPYFIFGDAQTPVHLWFVDLARNEGQLYEARGSSQVEPSETELFDTSTSYDRGEWSVVFKRSLGSRGGVSFREEQFTPIAFSVWDGFNHERGNKRALSAWFYVYNEPTEVVSAVGPMARAALLTLLLEIVVIVYIRRKFSQPGAAGQPSGALPEGGAAI